MKSVLEVQSGLFFFLSYILGISIHADLFQIVWLGTFFGVILLNVTYGLVIGVFFGILSLFYRIIRYAEAFKIVHLRSYE